MIYDKEYFLERINANNYERLEITEGHNEKLTHPVLISLKGQEVVKDGAKRFAETSAGRYTIWCRDKEQQPAKSAQRFFIDINNAGLTKYEAPAAPAMNGAPDLEKLRREISAQVRAEIKAEQAEARLKELEEENERLKKLSSRGEVFLNSAVDLIEKRFFEKRRPVDPVMNGTVKSEELAEAYEDLTDLFTPQGVVKLAKLLKNDPNATTFVKNYAKL